MDISPRNMIPDKHGITERRDRRNVTFTDYPYIECRKQAPAPPAYQAQLSRPFYQRQHYSRDKNAYQGMKKNVAYPEIANKPVGLLYCSCCFWQS
jgi:hypothetical protein